MKKKKDIDTISQWTVRSMLIMGGIIIILAVLDGLGIDQIKPWLSFLDFNNNG